MKEKDIENLIALYPEEFFPKANFNLKGQQVKLGSCYADILFTDKYDRQIIIEVKRGILSRDAAGQIIEYYGLLKMTKPDAIIELIICANTIPHERKLFLENVGIECKELGLALIQKVAAKYNYTFLDDLKEENKKKSVPSDEINRSDFCIDDSLVNTWIFQANPKRYDILNALSDPEVQHYHWTVNQYKEKIKQGDVALIWMSGKEAGIYAIAEIASSPAIMSETPVEDRYWVDNEDRGKKQLRVELINKIVLINRPVFRHELRAIEALKDMRILRVAQGTNFPIAPSEWIVIKGLINTRIKTSNQGSI
jgi:hypothetical protein